MNSLTILDNIQIASPCEADWAKMAGDDRTRFCSDCSKHVYNIASMTAEEATNLIVETQGNLCVRIYRRHDGTVLTADCPVGLRKISGGRRLRRALAVGVVLPALAVAGVTAMGMSKREIEPMPSGPGVTWDDRIDWALITLGLRQRPVPTAGFMVLPPSLLTPSSSSGGSPVAPASPE
jgi:hypothetical protein